MAEGGRGGAHRISGTLSLPTLRCRAFHGRHMSGHCGTFKGESAQLTFL
jgi:hypothetical protein